MFIEGERVAVQLSTGVRSGVVAHTARGEKVRVILDGTASGRSFPLTTVRHIYLTN